MFNGTEGEQAPRRRRRNLEPKTDVNRLTLTVPEAGKILGICRNAAYEAASTGEIPTVRIGRRLLVPKKALEKILAGDSGIQRGPE
jgi:excisionase family DNA binding protein